MGSKSTSIHARRFFETALQSNYKGSTRIRSEQDARRFLQGILSYEDRVELLALLVSSSHGQECLRQALSICFDATFINENVLPFFKYLAHEDLILGSRQQFLSVLLTTIRKVPFLMDTLAETAQSGQLSDEAALGYFVLQVMSSGGEDAVEARKTPSLLKLAEYLTRSTSLATRQISRRISIVLDGSQGHSSSVLQSLLQMQVDVPGGRHSNDKEDYRSIALIPTADEVNCDERPFLVRADHMEKVMGSGSEETHALDRQFRLLREDFVAPLREELKELKAMRTREKVSRTGKRQHGRLFPILEVMGIQVNAHSRSFVRIAFDLPPPLKIAWEKLHNQEKKQSKNNFNKWQPAGNSMSSSRNFWEQQVRVLPRDCLVCILRDLEVVSFATILERDINHLVKLPFTVGLAFTSDAALRAMITSRNNKSTQLYMFQVSASFFGYEPILSSLQRLSGVQFSEELIYWKPGNVTQPPSYFHSLKDVWETIRAAHPTKDLSDTLKTTKPVILDPSQRDSIAMALSRRVAVLQGPPGTGKSFCGALVGKVIHDYTREVIICVCYTNHALDQFLEELMDIGVPMGDIVRLGGSGKVSSRCAPLLVGALTTASKQTSSEAKTYFSLKARAQNLEDLIGKRQNAIDPLVSHWAAPWGVIGPFLREQYSNYYRALTVPASRDGMFLVGAGGQQMKHDALWKAWIAGKGPTKGAVLDEARVWELSLAQRQTLIERWKGEILEPLVDDLTCRASDFDRVQALLKELKSNKRVTVLKNKRIIGCTTTGAANYWRELESVRAGVLLIEEAGEILEAHVMTSLPEKCKHIIMIGDHKQLRPKVNQYELTVESTQGYDLNRSLFERLCLNEFPHSTLQLQHRMRPEISQLVRSMTYPNLRDGDRVQTYPQLMGVEKSLVFIHHEMLEAKDDINQVNEDGLSKTNHFEAEMITKMVCYMLQQGYTKDQLVVLTPYLGQLQVIRSSMANVLNTAFNDMDIAELNRTEGDLTKIYDPAPFSLEKKPLRISSIDNYQGEEADVVIISLVRSNLEGNIGFLSIPERVNVMLSRARHGMLLLGNAETLRNARNVQGKMLWRTLFDLLDKGGHVFVGFPAVCQRHPGCKTLLCSPKQFDELTPNGGCSAPCETMMNCGVHKCPLKCHPAGDHSKMECKALCIATCPKGHDLKYQCHQKSPGKCNTCWRLEKLEQQKRLREEKIAEEAAKKQAEYQLQLSEADAKLQEKRRLLQDLHTTHDRKIRLHQLKVEDWKLEEELNIRVANSENQLKAKFKQAEEASTCAIVNLKKNTKSKFVYRQKNVSGSSDGFNTDESCTAPKDIATGSEEVFEIDGVDLEQLMNEANAHPPRVPPELGRGLKLMADNEISSALQYFKKLDSRRFPDANTLCALCRAGLDDSSLADEVQKWNQEYLSDLEGHNVLIRFYSLCFVLDWTASLGGVPENPVGRSKLETMACGYGKAFLAVLDKFKTDPLLPDVWIRNCREIVDRRSKDILKADNSSKDSSESAASLAWQHEKDVNMAQNQPLDVLMKMTGLEAIKDQFLSIYNSLNLAKQQGISLQEKRLNVICCGNPGTGKTTVARLYANFLFTLGALSGEMFVETSGADLVHEGVEGLKNRLKDIADGDGGVLFIDEAYQLDPLIETQGKRVLDYLLAEVENNIGRLVVAMAGYQTKMEKLLEHNEGLPSRFPYTLNFADYSDSELMTIMHGVLHKKFKGRPFNVEEGLGGKPLRILIKRLGRGRGSVGFGNARAVEILLEKVLERQAGRICRETKEGGLPDIYFISQEDLLGPDPAVALSRSEAWRELNDMIGLKSVKKSVESLVEIVKTNVEREKMELPPLEVTLNRIFLGNPGTGKTTVAGLYGRILTHLGLLSDGQVVIKKPSDFVGAVLGESEKLTRGILQATIGKVLVIDEAYGLYSAGGAQGKGGGFGDPYKAAVIDTIVGEVQNVPGEDRCVLLLGYRTEMENMVNNCNPGFARRFSVEDAFQFSDFTEDELCRILNLKLRKKQIKVSQDGQRAAMGVLSQRRRRPNFGNGGEIENLLTIALQRMQHRQRGISPADRAVIELKPEDFNPDWREGNVAENANIGTIFEGLIGCDNIVLQMEQYKNSIQLASNMGRDPFQHVPTNFRFIGPPGTGKTTVARRMGRLFHSLGILASDDIVEASASDLLGQYVGQTGPKTVGKLREALGKVLFIDEAYRLNPDKYGNFAREAMDELVDQLTKPEFHKKLVVILAGYERDIANLMQANAGLSSRFHEAVVFRKFSEDECTDLLYRALLKEGFEVQDFDHVRMVFSQSYNDLTVASGWGNGRDINSLAQDIIREVAAAQDNKISASDVVEVPADAAIVCIERMRESKRRGIVYGSEEQSPHGLTLEREHPAVAPHQIKISRRAINIAPPSPAAAAVACSSDCNDQKSDEKSELPTESERDAGVSDQIWNDLQTSIRIREAKELAIQDELKRLERARERAEEEARLAEELARQAEDERRRVEAERKAREARELAERRRRQEEARRAEEQRRKIEEQRVQERLKHMGLCCMGFRWIQQSCGGYRCAGGSHFVSACSLGL